MSQSIADQIQKEEERARGILVEAEEQIQQSMAQYQSEERARLEHEYQGVVKAATEKKATGEIVAEESYHQILKTEKANNSAEVSDEDIEKTVKEGTEFFISLLSS